MRKKTILLSMLLFGATVTMNAQTGIGTAQPNQSAQLDITSSDKGVLIPRIALTSATQQLQTTVANQTSLLIYNTATVAAESLTPGYYYWDSNKWIRMIAENDESLGGVKFFYMPSIVINTSTNGTFKRNLHAEYVSQFTNKEFVPDATTGGSVGTAVRPTFLKSTGAPDEIPNTPNPGDLYYYVTDYDDTALEITDIDANGIMTYEVIGTGTDYSFVNIVFVVK